MSDFSGSLPNATYVCCSDTAAGVCDESCQALAAEGTDDVTLAATLDEPNHSSKTVTETTTSPSTSKELAGQRTQATRGDVTDSDAEEAAGETSDTEVPQTSSAASRRQVP